jgi:Acetyltransferase (GNAT) domain
MGTGGRLLHSQGLSGGGLATELVNAALAYGFAERRLPCIAAFARPANLASIHVLSKCGFELVRYQPTLARNHYIVQRSRLPDEYVHRLPRLQPEPPQAAVRSAPLLRVSLLDDDSAGPLADASPNEEPAPNQAGRRSH